MMLRKHWLSEEKLFGEKMWSKIPFYPKILTRCLINDGRSWDFFCFRFDHLNSSPPPPKNWDFSWRTSLYAGRLLSSFPGSTWLQKNWKILEILCQTLKRITCKCVSITDTQNWGNCGWNLRLKPQLFSVTINSFDTNGSNFLPLEFLFGQKNNSRASLEGEKKTRKKYVLE